ncbi:hypothetical protein FSP39_001199 [Pinctada imbricata]|uniref:Guanylate cyclase n=1 Tax=Pinctada imbricata TaxID=66713 RepID=A0AA89BPF5_PINIB|nr:hypothetical protein FSP39_001199 [Pinctada imbricata]
MTENLFQRVNSGTGVSNASEAQRWCETTVCPASKDANQENCCVHHFNLHSCPLNDVSNRLCGPWISPDGETFTHSSASVGPVTRGNWTSVVHGLGVAGQTDVIAHYKIAGMSLALVAHSKSSAENRNIIPVCGDQSCDRDDGEDCKVCPADCGQCPLEAWHIGLIATAGALVVLGFLIFCLYQKRKLLLDDSWIYPYSKINTVCLREHIHVYIIQCIFLSIDLYITIIRHLFNYRDGKTIAIRKINKHSFQLTRKIREEVRSVRELDHPNVCRFVGGCVEVPDVSIMMEYCPKGGLSDVLLNDDIPLSWAFRFSFAGDIARGMAYLHGHKIIHGHLNSNNCVIDDRWTVKITDYGLNNFRTTDFLDDIAEEKMTQKRNRAYRAPEGTISEEADVYAYGVIMLEIATRNDPYGDQDQDSWIPKLPALEKEFGSDDACPCPHDVTHMEKYSRHLETIVAERTRDLVIEKQKTDRLLYSMLPKQVADVLRQGSPVEAETFDSCTIFFSDIVGFTSLSGSSTAMDVVNLLNKLYITFDSVIEKHDVYKVETIGDAYMVVSGVPNPTSKHSCEIANMALELVEMCRTFVIPHKPGETLKIRVGLHSGSVCAGVVGLKMPRYCLFGDTVNTASRMESNGEAFKIHLSEYTHKNLDITGQYNCEERGTIDVKVSIFRYIIFHDLLEYLCIHTKIIITMDL